MRRRFLSSVLSLALFASGCYAGVWSYRSQGGGAEAAVGEEHQVNYPASDSFLLTQDVLRGDGILYQVQPQDSLTTFWKPADNQPGFWAAMLGVQPRYRYEIHVVPEGPNSSKLVVNVRTEDVPQDQLDHYKASQRLHLFQQFDELAKITPPSSNTPTSGGVNYALLPNEDLKALAKRTTGNADNWQAIAKDNGISSPTDVTAFQNIWVRNDLIKPAKP